MFHSYVDLPEGNHWLIFSHVRVESSHESWLQTSGLETMLPTRQWWCTKCGQPACPAEVLKFCVQNNRISTIRETHGVSCATLHHSPWLAQAWYFGLDVFLPFPKQNGWGNHWTLQVSPLGMGQNLWNYHISWPINIHSPAISRYQEQTFDPPFWGWRWNLKIHSVGQNRPTPKPAGSMVMYTSFTKIGRGHSQFTGGRRWMKRP